MPPLWYQDYVERVNQVIDTFFRERYVNACSHVEATFQEALEYAVSAGGKRIRPILAMLSYEACAGHATPHEIIQHLIGIEYIHAFTLVHDDLPCMDNDILRRGKPTVWKKYGEGVGLLVGDTLHAIGFEAIAKSRNSEVILDMADALGDFGIMRGQLRDTLLDHTELSLEELTRIHDEKTGRLIVASLLIGARLAGEIDERVFENIRTFGILLGRAFQLRDDILDYEGDPDIVGKMTQKDTSQHKGLVALLGIEKAKELLSDMALQLDALACNLQSTKLSEIAEYIVNRES